MHMYATGDQPSPILARLAAGAPVPTIVRIRDGAMATTQMQLEARAGFRDCDGRNGDRDRFSGG